jgi:pimeloyl-ACP methyl ester carboxylesterase
MLCSGPAGRAGRHQADADFVAAHGTLALWDRENPGGAGTADERFVRERMAATSADNYLGGNTVLQTAPDVTADLVATGVRTLVAHGDADDAWPLDSQRDMAERMGAAYAVIPAAGHLPNVENPTFTARLLSDFWAGTTRNKGDE